MWVDGRGRAAYNYFHDIVILDATYLTNMYIFLYFYFYFLFYFFHLHLHYNIK
jgi:hypothetical protein